VTIDEMFDELDLYGFDDFEDSQKLVLLNEAYFDIVTREPWPFMERVEVFTAPAGTSRITNSAFAGSPTDLGSVLSFVDTGNKVVMTPERADVVEKSYQVDSTAMLTSVYYFVGDELFVYPELDAATNFRLYYLRVPAKLSESTDEFDILIPQRHHSIIVYGALVKAFLVNDDPQAAAFQNAFESRYQQMRGDVWMNQYDRTERVFVTGDSTDWSY
jgi:hypothetical protein